MDEIVTVDDLKRFIQSHVDVFNALSDDELMSYFLDRVLASHNNRGHFNPLFEPVDLPESLHQLDIDLSHISTIRLFLFLLFSLKNPESAHRYFSAKFLAFKQLLDLGNKLNNDPSYEDPLKKLLMSLDYDEFLPFTAKQIVAITGNRNLDAAMDMIQGIMLFAESVKPISNQARTKIVEIFYNGLIWLMNRDLVGTKKEKFQEFLMRQLDKGLDPSIRMLEFVFWDNNLELVKYMIRKDYPLFSDDPSYNAFLYVKNSKMLDILLDYVKAHPEFQSKINGPANEEGRTPILRAFQVGLVDQFLANGAVGTPDDVLMAAKHCYLARYIKTTKMIPENIANVIAEMNVKEKNEFRRKLARLTKKLQVLKLTNSGRSILTDYVDWQVINTPFL